jgi:NitT/TauT family transport system permease protein
LLLVYAVPVFAVYPVLIAILGAGGLPVIAVGSLVAFPAVAANTAIGFRETPDVLISVARSVGLGRWGIVMRVMLPSAWPHVFSGVKLATSYVIIAVLGTQFILSTRGVGHEIAYAYNNFDLGAMYGAIVIALMLAIVAILLLGAVERRWSGATR